MTDRDWNWSCNWDWLRSPENGDGSQTDCESSESYEQTQAKTDQSTHSQTIHRRALLQTGLVALGFTGASSSGVSAATAMRMGARISVPGSLTGGLGADDRYLYAATKMNGSKHLSKVSIASGEEEERLSPAFDSGAAGYGAGTTPESRLFAADFNTSRVLEVDPVTGETSGGFDVFFDPAGVTYDPDRESLWISNITTNQVHEFSVSGTERGSFNAQSTTTPAGIAYHNGFVWLGDKEDPSHLYKYATDGQLRDTREVGPTINGAGGNSDGVITPDGTGDAVFTIGSPDISDSEPATIRGEIRTPTDDLVRSAVNYQIRRQADSQLVSSGDTNTGQFTATVPVNPPQVELAYPAQDGLAAGGGAVYTVESDDILKIRQSSGDVSARFEAPDGERAGLAYGDGSLWFSDAIGPTFDGAIVELNSDTGDIRSRINTSYDAVALAFGEGSLWVCDITFNRVVEYAPDGSQLSEFDTRGPTGSTGARGLAYADGSLYIGTDDTNAIFKFATDGALQRELDVPDRGYRGLGATDGALLGPDANGDVTTLRQLDDATDEITYRIELDQPTGGSGSTTVSVSPSETVTTDIVLANQTVSGQVTDASGQPVANATVRIPLIDGDLQTQTDATGQFRIDVSGRTTPDPVTVFVEKEGFVVKTLNIGIGDSQTVEVTEGTASIVQITDELHHLGDGNFDDDETGINSRFQEVVEGEEFETTFSLTDTLATPSEATLRFTVRGAESDNPIQLNGTQVGVVDTSDQSGTASELTRSVPPTVLTPGTNRIRIESINPGVPGDIDDFEFSNVRLELTGVEEVPEISISDATPVQIVANSRVTGQPSYEFPEPSIIPGRKVAVLFDLQLQPTGQLPDDENFEITISVDNQTSTTTEYSGSTLTSIAGGGLHKSFFDDQLPPVVELPSEPNSLSVDIEPADASSSVNGGSIRLESGQDFTTQTPGELNVAIARLDGLSDGTNATVEDFPEIVDEIEDRLVRRFPLDPDKLTIKSKRDPVQATTFADLSDIKLGEVKVGYVVSYLDQAAAYDALETQFQSFDFDAALVVVPNGYFEKLVPDPPGGVEMHAAVVQPQFAATAEAGSCPETAIHELGHHFLPPDFYPDVIAQRTDKPELDNDHARTTNYDLDDDDFVEDSPGVQSTLYKVKDIESVRSGDVSFFRTEAEATLGYVETDFSDGKAPDTLMYEQLAEGYTPRPPEKDLTASTQTVLSFVGVIIENGIIPLFESTRQGVPIPSVPTGDLSVTVEDDAGDIITTQQLQTTFQFTPQGESPTEVPGLANVIVPAPDSATTVQLEHDSGVSTAVTIPDDSDGFSLAEFDRDNDGEIGFDDLRYATREYNRENITFEQLRRVLRAYNTDQQV